MRIIVCYMINIKCKEVTLFITQFKYIVKSTMKLGIHMEGLQFTVTAAILNLDPCLRWGVEKLFNKEFV